MEYIVYAKINENNYIYDVNSSAFLEDTTRWVEIDRGRGVKYHHAQNNYFDKPIETLGRAYQYKRINGKVMECTPEEIAEQEEENKSAPSPSGDLKSRIATIESDVASLTAAIEKGLSL